jgi:hypothetical protein
MFNRDSAISLEIRDPDNPDQEHRIKHMLTLEGQLLIFSTTGIFRALTADTIDPERTYPDTRHSHEKMYSIGTSSGLVARTIIQFKEILDLAIQNAHRKEVLVAQVWHCTKLLLECEKSHYHIYKHTMDLLPKCDEIIEANKAKFSIPALPKIPDLNTQVSDFFMNGKLFLVETYRFLNEFFGLPFDGKNASHFDKHQKWIRERLGEQHPICKLLFEDENWIRIVSECSNAIRHPEKGQRVEVENISLKPGNKFSGPAWKYDLSKKGLGKQDYFTDVIHNFDVYQHNLTTFFEEILLLSIQDTLKDSPILALYKKPPERISPDCPIVYEVNLKQPFQP